MITVAQQLYNVAWRRANDTSLQFICEVACRSQLINGCSVTLDASTHTGLRNDKITLLSSSTDISGDIEAIAPRLVTIHFNNINPNLRYEYSAYALEAGATVYASKIGGLIQPLYRGKTINISCQCLIVLTCILCNAHCYIRNIKFHIAMRLPF